MLQKEQCCYSKRELVFTIGKMINSFDLSSVNVFAQESRKFRTCWKSQNIKLVWSRVNFITPLILLLSLFKRSRLANDFEFCRKIILILWPLLLRSRRFADESIWCWNSVCHEDWMMPAHSPAFKCYGTLQSFCLLIMYFLREELTIRTSYCEKLVTGSQ